MAMPGWLPFPRLHPQVWILVLGRFISQIGTGIVLFLAIFATANILFTTYRNWMESTLPLYFTRFLGHGHQGLAADTVGLMFSGYVLLVALVQLPLVQRLSTVQRVDVLRLSMVFWGAGFGLVALTQFIPGDQRLMAGGALTILILTYFKRRLGKASTCIRG
ncbi:MAG: hypothetical protein O3C67_05175 [Cyanobacteria bacterium]|nr:hypothetical protein [Cyanobacteriota bacterium]